jgi:hypothetical protein
MTVFENMVLTRIFITQEKATGDQQRLNNEQPRNLHCIKYYYDYEIKGGEINGAYSPQKKSGKFTHFTSKRRKLIR